MTDNKYLYQIYEFKNIVNDMKLNELFYLISCL